MDYRGREPAAIDGEWNARSIGELLRDIGTNIQDIARSEIKLAKIELGNHARRMRSSAAPLVGGAVLGIYAIGFVLLAAMLALGLVLPEWLAALIVGAVLALCAAFGIGLGRERFREVRMPEKTMQTVKEDLQWMKEQARS